MQIKKIDFKLSAISRGLLFYSFLTMGGCVSAGTHLSEWTSSSDMQNDSMVYAGTCHSLLMLKNHDHGTSLGETLAILAFFDLGGTMAMDTLLLPWDLTSDFHKRLSGKPSAKSVCDVLNGS